MTPYTAAESTERLRSQRTPIFLAPLSPGTQSNLSQCRAHRCPGPCTALSDLAAHTKGRLQQPAFFLYLHNLTYRP